MNKNLFEALRMPYGKSIPISFAGISNNGIGTFSADADENIYVKSFGISFFDSGDTERAVTVDRLKRDPIFVSMREVNGSTSTKLFEVPVEIFSIPKELEFFVVGNTTLEVNFEVQQSVLTAPFFAYMTLYGYSFPTKEDMYAYGLPKANTNY
jgi:hypothetical protein